MVITSSNNPMVLDINKLHNLKTIKERGLFLVEGEHLVTEAINAGVIEKIICTEEYKYPNIETVYVSSNVISKLSATKTPQGVIGICRCNNKAEIKGNVLILDGISDPGNMGTILRTCAAYNISTVICSNDTVSIYNDKVIRSTQGAIFKVNVLYTNLLDMIPSLKSNGYKIYATSLATDNILGSFDINDKYCIIIGNEANGVRKETLASSDIVFKIPMSGDMESLNAGVAAAICIWEFSK